MQFGVSILSGSAQLDNVAIAAIQCDTDGKKNYTDFYLLNDIYETLIDRPDINTYVIVTGDGHFKGVLAKLKFKHQKNVVVISVKGCVNKALKSFTFYELEPQNTRQTVIRYIDKSINEYGYITFQQAVRRAESELRLNIFPVLSQLVDEGAIKKKIVYIGDRDSTVLTLNKSVPEVTKALDYLKAS